MLKEIKQGILFTLVTMVLLGGAYHVLLWGIGRVAFPAQAEGSLIRRADGTSVGSRLIAQKFAKRMNKNIESISNEQMATLLQYDWPGNVRELENVLRRATLLSEGVAIRLADLSPHIRGGPVSTGLDGKDRLGLAAAVARTVERVERALIQSTLAECHGNRTAAAESLGINRKTLFNKLKQYGMTIDDEDLTA